MSVGGCGWKTAMFFPTSPCTARIARGAHNDAMQGSHDMAPTVNRYQPFTRKAASNQVSLFHIWSTIKTSTNNNPQIVPISGRVCLRASRIRQCGPHGWKKSEKYWWFCVCNTTTQMTYAWNEACCIPGQPRGTAESAGSVWFEDLGLSACFFQRNNFSKAKRRWTYLKFKWSWFCL